MIVCFYVRILLIESYYRIKTYIDKIKELFKKNNNNYNDSNIFSDIHYNPFKDQYDNDNLEQSSTNYNNIPEIVITQPESTDNKDKVQDTGEHLDNYQQNLISNWDIIGDEVFN